jgi:hypothetical protein
VKNVKLILLIITSRSKANIINLKNYFSVTKFSPPKRNPKRGVPFLKSKKKSPKRFLSDNKNALGHFYYKKTL